jgi:hypothetical protein
MIKKTTRVNPSDLLNPQSGSQYRDNPVERKTNMKLNFQSTQC